MFDLMMPPKDTKTERQPHGLDKKEHANNMYSK